MKIKHLTISRLSTMAVSRHIKKLVGTIVFFMVLQVMFSGCKKHGIFVLKDKRLDCDADSCQLVIESADDTSLKGEVIQPAFEGQDNRSIQEKEKNFYRHYKGDTLFYHKIVVEGTYSTNTYDDKMYDGCSDAHILVIENIISITKTNPYLPLR